MCHKLFASFLGILLLGFLAGHATATVVFYNGHYYEDIRVPEQISWTEAESAARAMVFQGLYGHLATITSQAENDFIVNTFLSVSGSPLIGGYQLPSSPEPSGGWAWITGETWDYTNWLSGEPNNTNGNENSLCLKPSGSVYGWNDIGSGNPQPDYIVEWDEYSEPVVPEPSTISLLLFALSSILCLRRR